MVPWLHKTGPSPRARPTPIISIRTEFRAVFQRSERGRVSTSVLT